MNLKLDLKREWLSLRTRASLECNFPHFNLTYCELRPALFVDYWQLCKRVHSIHYCIFVNTTIVCITIILTVEWFTIYLQYSIKYWSIVWGVDDSLTFFDYLGLGSSCEVEDNRRWVSSQAATPISWIPLRCSEPSNAVVIMSRFHQRYRGSFVITQPMEVFISETMFWSLVELLRSKSFFAQCFNQILFFLYFWAAVRCLNNLLLPSFKPFIDFFCLRVRLRLSYYCLFLFVRLHLSLKLLLLSWDNFYLVNALFFVFFWSLRYFHRF